MTICRSRGWEINLKELDIVRDEAHDMTQTILVDGLVASLERRELEGLVTTPPCNTHTRV